MAGPVSSRLSRLERRLGLTPSVPEDGEFVELAVEEWIESWRDEAEIRAEWAQGSDHWRRVYEGWLPRFEAAEAEAAAVGPGGVIRHRRLSEGAERQLEEMIEKLRRDWGPTIDAARAERRARRAPWPAPFRSRLELEGHADAGR